VRRTIAIEADCGDVASIDAMIARTVAELGRLDVIVNNAGVTRYAQIMDFVRGKQRNRLPGEWPSGDCAQCIGIGLFIFQMS
jgi:NAD(P)-dependent dehydrogenase (short-subunit alcohol dehydrogenase family)